MSAIRRAEKQDLAGIKALLVQVLGVHHVGRPDLFKEIGQKYTDEELLDIIADDVNPVFVFVEDEKVLGHCFCQTIDRPDKPACYAYKTLYIDDLCVDENARGKHVGKALYDYVKDYAMKNGYYNITLHAWECNPNAVGFYKHLGLEIQQYTMEEILK
ncbi:MAG: GNAT family N-acetyltransferase [Lachnospiraceae bacterium]|nr:GNAT family N-acetyltransferase [Lachnospiraceae bacterium]